MPVKAESWAIQIWTIGITPKRSKEPHESNVASTEKKRLRASFGNIIKKEIENSLT
jgi:hypothetical protein